MSISLGHRSTYWLGSNAVLPTRNSLVVPRAIQELPIIRLGCDLYWCLLQEGRHRILAFSPSKTVFTEVFEDQLQGDLVKSPTIPETQVDDYGLMALPDAAVDDGLVEEMERMPIRIKLGERCHFFTSYSLLDAEIGMLYGDHRARSLLTSWSRQWRHDADPALPEAVVPDERVMLVRTGRVVTVDEFWESFIKWKAMREQT